eukprot:scaffold301977_cov35-Tisochrysis_lutea.AAC.1
MSSTAAAPSLTCRRAVASCPGTGKVRERVGRSSHTRRGRAPERGRVRTWLDVPAVTVPPSG